MKSSYISLGENQHFKHTWFFGDSLLQYDKRWQTGLGNRRGLATSLLAQCQPRAQCHMHLSVLPPDTLSKDPVLQIIKQVIRFDPPSDCAVFWMERVRRGDQT